MVARNWPQAADAYRKLTALSPRAEYFRGLGDAEANRGQYQAALDAYDKGYKAVKNDRATEAALLMGMGNSFVRLKRNGEAVAAYTRAAGTSPTPGVAWFNLCALQYNMGQLKPALDACNKAIQADPARADAYFVKGSIMVGDATTGKGNKLVFPPGTVEALKKYLELAPNGPHAADVKEMLDAAK
jgi:tetratricopeptide (TPR) repeat protein